MCRVVCQWYTTLLLCKSCIQPPFQIFWGEGLGYIYAGLCTAQRYTTGTRGRPLAPDIYYAYKMPVQYTTGKPLMSITKICDCW